MRHSVQAMPALQSLRDRPEHRWRGREIGPDGAAEPVTEQRRERVIAGARPRIDRAIIDPVEKGRNRRIVEPVFGQVLAERCADHLMARRTVHLRATRRDDRQPIGEQPVEVEIIERGKEHALSKVARCPEQDQCLDFDAHNRPLEYPSAEMAEGPRECNAHT